MRAELASVLFVAITISTCVASRGAQSEPKDKQSVTRDAKVGDAQIAMTEHFQLEVILNSDRTWQFENQAYNYSRREVRPSKTLIPEGYVGWITIQYGVKGAPPLRIEDGYIVIRIPPTGELKTSSLPGYSSCESDERSGVYDYSRNHLRPIIVEEGWGWIGPQPVPLSDEERTILATSNMFRGDNDVLYKFFVGTKSQLQKYGGRKNPANGSFEPLNMDDGRYSVEISSTSVPLTSEDTQSAFTKSGRRVTLNTDALNRRTWTYAEQEPVMPDTSVLNVELSAAIKEAIALLEARRYEDFWRRFHNPYLRNTGYEDPRPKDRPIDGAQAWINLFGREGFEHMLQEMVPPLLESLRKIQNSQPVYSRIEYSKNIKASFPEDGDINSDVNEKQAGVPFMRVDQAWYIYFR